jgi:hypothetical protein
VPVLQNAFFRHVGVGELPITSDASIVRLVRHPIFLWRVGFDFDACLVFLGELHGFDSFANRGVQPWLFVR